MVDIDEKDFENPQLCAEYTQDMYAYLRLVKEKIIRCFFHSLLSDLWSLSVLLKPTT